MTILASNIFVTRIEKHDNLPFYIYVMDDLNGGRNGGRGGAGPSPAALFAGALYLLHSKRDGRTV